MFPKFFTDHVTRPQRMAWELVVAKCRSLDDLGTGEGWVFHGTDALTATWIERVGFRDRFLPGPFKEDLFHWGSAEMAAGYAEKRALADSPPVILAARTKDVLASGEARLDHFAMEVGCSFRGPPFPDHPDIWPNEASPVNDWRSSYLATGAFCVAGGHQVNGIVRHGIDRLGLHPKAIEARQERLQCHWFCQPHPDDHVQPDDLPIDREASLFPNSLEGWLQGNRLEISEERVPTP